MSQGGPRRVLVVEDDAGIRNNVMLMLEVEGYAVSGAEDGRSGLEAARSVPPDLILCDVMMPELDGFAVLEALRADPRLADIPFVFLTALDDRPSARRGMNLGADDYIAKPFTRDELLEAVSGRLRKHEALVRALAFDDASKPEAQRPEDAPRIPGADAELAAGAPAAAVLGQTLRLVVAGPDGALAATQFAVPGYRVVSMIGYGGSSVVYLAEREEDGKRVVLKILKPASAQDQVLRERFAQEFDIVSSIDHPNVIKIYDRGFSGGNAYIAMEYFPGGSLLDLLATGLTGRQALSLLAQAASALREIHDRGVLHRDVKPANFMVRSDGSIALTDFGIAKRLAGGFDRTRHGELYGTPYYISPEQIEGGRATERSDIYSLGIIFYEMLARKRPFDAESVSELIALHIKAPRPRLPEALAEYQGLLDRMLAVDPRGRYQSAEELLEAIDAVWTKQALRGLQSGK